MNDKLPQEQDIEKKNNLLQIFYKIYNLSRKPLTVTAELRLRRSETVSSICLASAATRSEWGKMVDAACEDES